MAQCMTPQALDWHCKELLSLQAEMSHLKTANLSVDFIDRATNLIRAAQTTIDMCTARTRPFEINIQKYHLITILALYAALWICFATFVEIIYRCLPSGLRKGLDDVYHCIPVISPLTYFVALCIVHTGGVIRA